MDDRKREKRDEARDSDRLREDRGNFIRKEEISFDDPIPPEKQRSGDDDEE